MALKKKTKVLPFSLKARLERFEERYAILRGEGIELRWPIKQLPDNVNPGDEVTVMLKTKTILQDDEYRNMRKLLTELVN